jgi:hypothetical protein
MTREREGLLLCLVSAAGFGAMPIFAKLFGETLGPLQLAGGALVLSAVVLLQLRSASPASLVRDELDVERGRERARELQDVLPAHPRTA